MHLAQALYYTEPEQHPALMPQQASTIWASLYKSQHYHIELSCIRKNKNIHLRGYVTRYFGENVHRGLVTLKAHESASKRDSLSELGRFEFDVTTSSIVKLEILLEKEGVIIPQLEVRMKEAVDA